MIIAVKSIESANTKANSCSRSSGINSLSPRFTIPWFGLPPLLELLLSMNTMTDTSRHRFSTKIQQCGFTRVLLEMKKTGCSNQRNQTVMWIWSMEWKIKSPEAGGIWYLLKDSLSGGTPELRKGCDHRRISNNYIILNSLQETILVSETPWPGSVGRSVGRATAHDIIRTLIWLIKKNGRSPMTWISLMTRFVMRIRQIEQDFILFYWGFIINTVLHILRSWNFPIVVAYNIRRTNGPTQVSDVRRISKLGCLKLAWTSQIYANPRPPWWYVLIFECTTYRFTGSTIGLLYSARNSCSIDSIL